MSAPLETTGLWVRYGRTVVVEDLTFSVPRGSVFALLGRNGAGKSSLLRVLLGQRPPARGRVRLLGEDPWRRRATLLARVGVVPEEPDAAPDATPHELSAFCFGVNRDLALTTGAAGAVGFGVAAAVVIGSSMLARDAASGRLGFLFSRPVPWGAIWGGKWLAAIALAAACAFLAAIPWMVAFPLSALGGHHGESWWQAFWRSDASVRLAVVLLLSIGLANFNGTAFRSRSPWLAADLLLALLAGWAVRRYVAPLAALRIVDFQPISRWGLLAPLGFLAAALLVASAVQVARGRTDLRRAHAAMSLTFWAIVFATLALAAGRLEWARAARPSDLAAEVATSDATGRWVYVFGGSRRGGSPGFLIESFSGRFVSLGLLAGWWETFGALVSSTDGSHTATLVASTDGRSSGMVLFDLAGKAPRSRLVVFESSPPPGWGGAFDLSPSGSLALLVHGTGASLYAAPSGRRVATATLGPGWRSAAFVSDGRMVVAERPRGQVRLRVFDPNGVSTAETNLDFPAGAMPLRPGPEVSPGRLAVAAGTPFLAGGVTLVVDVATGEVVERLEGLVPAPAAMGLASSPVRHAGSVHFFLGPGPLVRIDFATGERRVVAGPGAPRDERIRVD